MKKIVIVSGANGFIGIQLVKLLHTSGYKVYSLVEKNSTNLQLIKNYSFKIIDGDFSCSDLHQRLPINATCFIHLAWRGVNGMDKGNTFVQDDNITMSKNAFKLASSINCKRFIGIGTITELSYELTPKDIVTPSLIYGKYKRKCFKTLEELSKKSETEFVWLMLSNLYGVTNNTGNLLSYTINEINSGKDATFGPSDQPYDFLLVDDAIRAIFKVATKKDKFSNNIYYIGSGTPRLLKEYLFEIGRIFNAENKIKIGVRPFDGALYSDHFFSIVPILNEIGNYVSNTFDINVSKIRKDLENKK